MEVCGGGGGEKRTIKQQCVMCVRLKKSLEKPITVTHNLMAHLKSRSLIKFIKCCVWDDLKFIRFPGNVSSSLSGTLLWIMGEVQV